MKFVFIAAEKALYPVVPLASRQALGIAVMSYDGHLGFGLLADYDALPELETIAHELERAIAALTKAASANAKSPSAKARTAKTVGTRAKHGPAKRPGAAAAR